MYIGTQPAIGQNRKLDSIAASFNGVLTTFNLTVATASIVPSNVYQLFISLGGVLQNPGVDFTASGNQITFTTAPTAGLSFFGIFQGDSITGTPTIADATITTAKLATGLTVTHTAGTAAAPSITFAGDLANGAFAPAANTFGITTGGTERLRITSAGNVGIGTTAPSQLLEIKGANARFAVNSTTVADGGILLQGNGTTYAEIKLDASSGILDIAEKQAAGNITFSTGTTPTERVRVDSSGRVGIGTTSPGQALSVAGNILSSSVGTNYVASSSQGVTTSYLITDASGSNLQVDGAWPIRFTTNSNERARIDSSGRLLVGTSSTASAGDSQYARLQVKGNTFLDSGFGIISVLSGTTIPASGNTVGAVLFAGITGNEFARIDCIADAATGSGDYPGRFVFSTTADGASSSTERMRITNTGTTTVFATTANVIGAASNQAAGTTYYLFYGANNATSTTSGTTCFLVYTNGNVQNTNNSYAGISDVKLKENIVDAGSQWSDLKALQVRKYNFKKGQTHTQIGLVAQEVELVSPGLVSESPDRDEDGNDLGTITKSVNYSVLYMKAVKALQEAMERIEILETSNLDLLARVTALETA